jgi:hypothetical protein
MILILRKLKLYKKNKPYYDKFQVNTLLFSGFQFDTPGLYATFGPSQTVLT